MKIFPEHDDSPDFVLVVDHVANGLLRRYAPKTLVVIKIDNWFGSNWLGFSGKALGAIGVWDKPYYRPATDIRIPPFVPSRVVSQRTFLAPDYVEVGAGNPIHLRIPSGFALLRKARRIAPDTLLLWYSGNSEATGRGAVMAYVPVKNSYWPWYAAWEKGEPWRIVQTWDIKREDLLQLLRVEQLAT